MQQLRGWSGSNSLSVCLRGWKLNDALCIESIFDATETDGRTDRHDVDEGNHLLIAIGDDLLKSLPALLTSLQIINVFESFNSRTRAHLRFSLIFQRFALIINLLKYYLRSRLRYSIRVN